MKILALGRYGSKGASSRVRLYQYVPHLMERGFRIETSPFLADEYLQTLYENGRRSLRSVGSAYLRRVLTWFRAGRFDVLWIEKELFPWLPAFAETLLDWLRIPYVVDYDDAVFHHYDRHPNPLIRTVLGRKIDAVMHHAQVVLAGNDYLAQRAVAAGARRVEILPTTVDLAQYPEPRFATEYPSQETVTIGWIGTPVTAAYLQALLEPLRELARTTPNTRFLWIGAGSGSPDLPRSQSVPWSQADESELLHSLDVGIMPLPDQAWERGKCGYKLIQYMACGKAVVASPVGVNREIVEHGVDGFLASSENEWIASLRSLIVNPSLRRHMGMAARKKVVRRYSLQSQIDRLSSIFRDAGQA
ncbi:MAG TPA: glycosyltransferase family 4 protein [Methylococcus sp.]|nr:glycosyltransferase family 4 protein [Methylococcus sp.]